MPQKEIYDESAGRKIEKRIDGYIERYFGGGEKKVTRIKNSIWTVEEDLYDFNIIQTTMLCVFDAILLDRLPERSCELFEELLVLNAHRVKSSKLCLIKGRIHLRIVKGLGDFGYSEFVDHVQEYREIFPRLKVELTKKYYPEEVQ